MKESEIITENLFAFYKQIVDKTNQNLFNFKGLENVSPADNSWPSYVLSNRLLKKKEIQEISEKMKSGEFSPFWIRETLDNDPFDAIASDFGIRKINLWRGMILEKEESFNFPAPVVNLVFERVKSLKEIDNWVDIVNAETMKGRKISKQIFRDLLPDDAYGFFQLRFEENIISTLLMYNFRGSIGLYLLATAEKYRGKGLGKFITSRAIDYYIQKANTKFVLHSTKLGYPLQVKLGFKTVCDYGIYWLLGKT